MGRGAEHTARSVRQRGGILRKFRLLVILAGLIGCAFCLQRRDFDDSDQLIEIAGAMLPGRVV